MNILNDNYTQYISKDEKIIEFTDISNNVSLILAFIKSCCFSFLFFIFYISTIIEKTYNIKHFNKFEEGLILTLFFLIFCFAYLYFKYKSMKYLITDNGILEIKGIFFKTYKFIPFIKITDIRLSRNIFDLILGTGNVDISTAGGTRIYNGNSQPYEIRFLHIDNFTTVNEIIKKSITKKAP